jgi:peptidoglycan L-alanyl-D-glutamate endopeptidase CwlK
MKNKEIYIGLGIGVAVTTLLILIFRKKPTENIENMEVEKTWDTKTDDKIKTLHPKLRGIASKFINEVEKKLGIRLRITDGLRTFAEQNKLYAQGRTTAGRKVTNAKGGQSYHNYGLAFDCYLTENGKVTFKKAVNSEIAKIGKDLGLEWGGEWKTLKDMPHFQLTKGKTSELLALHNAKKTDSEGYVLV